MYSCEDRVRAVKLYIKLGGRLRATIRQLGYLSRQGPVLLLCGSDKADQDRAIRQAIAYQNDWKERG